jgi:L-fucose isomerase-like protein
MSKKDKIMPSPSQPGVLPRVGLILLRAEWFDSVVALPDLAEALRADAGSIENQLRQLFDVTGIWVVNSPQSLEVAGQALPAAEVDLFVLAFQVWAEDFYLLPLVKAIGDRPLAVWCYLPWRSPPPKLSFVDVLRGSGPVGTFEGIGTLRNLGVRYFFTQGAEDDPRVIHDLVTTARAGRIRRLLRRARFGLLPSHNEQMQSTFVDEFRLLADLGPTVQYLTVGELARTSAALPEAEVQAFLEDLRGKYPIRGVSEETLFQAGRVSLGLAHLAAEYKLDVLSFNDIASETHEVFGLRPCLYPPLFDQAGIHVGLEGDLGAATALFILQCLTSSPSFFIEIWFWDEAENIVIGGHAGLQNPAIALPEQVWISQDCEFSRSDRTEGAHLQFVACPGRVTLLNLRCTPQSWQAIVTRGESIPTEPRLEGYPHAVIRLDVPVDQFVRCVAKVGSTQHWIMAYGDFVVEVQALCELAGIPLESVV